MLQHDHAGVRDGNYSDDQSSENDSDSMRSSNVLVKHMDTPDEDMVITTSSVSPETHLSERSQMVSLSYSHRFSPDDRLDLKRVHAPCEISSERDILLVMPHGVEASFQDRLVPDISDVVLRTVSLPSRSGELNAALSFHESGFLSHNGCTSPSDGMSSTVDPLVCISSHLSFKGNACFNVQADQLLAMTRHHQVMSSYVPDAVIAR